MIKKTFSIITLAAITLFSQSTFALFSKASAMDLDGFYITPKVGYSASMDTGRTIYRNSAGGDRIVNDNDLGDGYAFGFSAGKYIKENIRIEFEAMTREDYRYDSLRSDSTTRFNRADISSTALFINGFYEFQPASISNKSFVPYLGGGIGGSRNKMGRIQRIDTSVDGDTVEEFAYKLSAGTLFSLKENLSLDVAYQYLNLGGFNSTFRAFNAAGARNPDLSKRFDGGEIESHEIMIGLQYKF